ncbi:MAG: sirohydrochlorin chelatase [Sumerlaeia bacterium]
MCSVTSISNSHVVFVAHGSRAARWVEAQQQWWGGVNERLLRETNGALTSELTFLEIADPLFDDCLARLKNQQKSLLIFPFFLSQSGHATEDIPEILEKHLQPEQYTLLKPTGWTGVLARNFDRRVLEYGGTPEDPVIISGYGASHHDHLWQQMILDIQACSQLYQDQPNWHWAPSGHFFEDFTVPLRNCLKTVSETHERCVVFPLYLAVSSYQEKLIPETSAEFPKLTVLTAKDSILPDPLVEEWAAGQVLLHYKEECSRA